METPAQLAITLIATNFIPLLARVSPLLLVFPLVPFAQHPINQLNVALVLVPTSYKEMPASNPVTQDIMQTPAMCVSNVATLANRAQVLLFPAHHAQVRR